ncbi:hypothetical protein DDB_G0292700 [Dictyostelium discoideum AX4]|uniref:AB hydrolase-1 domain-containing protein n=1 Tax=Dictyostelium discoideum TaxID=44689 RepID=Q54CU1_DICDI|nr:hypothetical protein DDB_G0292700 [Dictyostelium discoideum AX4]EAL61153.1 hypothetical protein DDB_G0292700 [Dictyostelium discoideum AX4]|eukprot:XP_629579.1 hypothetical protein DDB_G0292700 [Dictyostelium discoideum AX4]
MAYKIYGEGEKKILFVMGVLSKGNNWSSSVEYFKQFPKYQICIFDHSGVGESSNSSLFGINGLASDTLELLDYLKWDKVNVVGITMGASVSYELSIIAPNRIKTLNLTSFCQNIEKTLFQNGIQRLLKLQLHSLLYDIDEPTLISNIMFSQSYLESKSKIKPIGKNKDYVIPLTGKLANDLKSVSWKAKLSHIYSLISYKIKQPYKPKRYAGHALYAEDIKSYNENVEKFISSKQNLSNKFLIHETLEYNSKTILNDHYSHLNYQKIPILQTPLFLNTKNNLNNNFANFKSTLLEKI